MVNPERKQPSRVRSISGDDFTADRVTDEDYAEAVKVQEMVLIAQGEERKVLGRLRLRLERGAKDEGQRYYFDSKLGIVRRRDKANSGS